MNDKLKFYRSTLVQIAKGLIGYTPMHKLAEDADKVAKEIIKKVDEYENSFNYQTQVNENSTITCNYPNFFKGVNPDYFKTEPIRTPEKEKDKNLKPFLDEYDSKHFELKFQEPMKTIVDHGPQYKTERKGIYELTNQDVDFIISEFKTLNSIISNIEMPSNKYRDILRILVDVPRFIYSKACEKCEE